MLRNTQVKHTPSELRNAIPVRATPGRRAATIGGRTPNSVQLGHAFLTEMPTLCTDAKPYLDAEVHAAGQKRVLPNSTATQA
jgi:hypothetical protein